MFTRQTALIAACLGLLLCSSLLAGPLDKEQVSARAKWVLHADVETFLASKTGGFILDEINKSGLDKWMVVVKNASGIDPSKDLKGVTLYGVDFEKDNGIVLIRAPMEQDTLLALLKTNETYRESKYGDHVIHQWTEKARERKPGAVKLGCFHQADLAVVAPSLDMLKLALDVLDKKADSLAKDSESKLLPAPAKGVFLTAAAVDLPQAAKQDPKAAILALINFARFQVGESEGKVFVRLTVTAKTPQIANDLRKIAEGFLAFLDIAKEIEENGKPVIPSEMGAVLKDVSVTVQDRTVEANAQSGTSNVISVLQWMIQQKKAAAKAAPVTIAEPARQSAKMKVLNRWLGTWKSHAVIKPSEWFPDGKKRAETKNVEWALDGHFQQVTIRSDEHETREIQRYDVQSKKYQKWTFDTYGGSGYWIGSWNEESKTMTWKLDVGVIKGTMVDRFVAAGKYVTTIVIKDVKGKLLLDVQAEHTRVKK